MKVQNLLRLWDETAQGQLTQEKYNIRLPEEDAAKLKALAEMYQRRSIDEIITDLLSAALEDVESSLPYVRGNAIVAHDEEGDPLYEDIGLTPRFLALTKKHMQGFRH